MKSLWKRWVSDVRVRADAQIEPGGESRVVVVLVTTMLCLLAIRFLGMPYEAHRLVGLLDAVGLDALGGALLHSLSEGPSARMSSSVYWSLARLLGYVAIPALVIRFALREKLNDYGFRVHDTARFFTVYLVLLAGIGPFVVMASYTPEFQSAYPFYPIAQGERLWPWFWAWEVLYALQFVSLEFFFRGFLLHGLVRRFGYLSIFVMMVPYMMIHFQKPALEALGSIIAGFVLGTLALESRSIWWGAMAHVSVALSMDFLALWHRGFF